ncbi:hypothetical protein EIJ81_00210 (plasmid) [Aliivibrio salmonicida]|uniref:hypothetical protein n=1 Tax=Aliivibrio salmonicida TaxID=40269 RepID=UPI000F6DE93D|nr:hypothetical protein [Aliivibrio salmonicida]AZL83326.1 hypothetical protein EIJ81_00210 [Aliivibrio salmonicida]
MKRKGKTSTGSKVKDGFIDVFDTLSNATTRSGHVLNRVHNLDQAGIDRNVIAVLMTSKSKNNFEYTETDIDAYAKLYIDCKSRVPLTAKAARAINKDPDE